jgi:hypothetical protein
MASGHALSVFVSSTCYDLAQVRHDLHDFLESLGMTPILSEFDSFPINPNLDTIGNCLTGIRDRADIFILVVGGRYGKQAVGGKSVTNLEYLEAKSKGIPRYIFVQKKVLTTLPVYQKNKTADFSDIVDSSNLFEFVESLSDPNENWVFPFDSAQDITNTLKNQFAFLFAEALILRRKILETDIPKTLEGLSGSVLMLLIQKSFAWEYYLFCQVLSEEISESYSFKKDLKYGLVLGQHAVKISDISQLKAWVHEKCEDIIYFIGAIEKIVNVVFPEAIGAPGEPANVEEIVYVARRFGQVYRHLLEWTGEFKRIQTNSDYLRVLDILSRASQNIIFEIEDFSIRMQQQLSEARKKYEKTKECQKLKIVLKLTCPDMSDLSAALKCIEDRIKSTT